MESIISELKALVKQWSVWFILGNQDIKLRYRRSAIGPLWITLSMAVTVYTMGFLYGHLLKIKLDYYFPYLAAGVIGWSFISSLIIDCSNSFIESENYIKNQETYFMLFVMRLVFRNFIIFLHNLLVYVPIIFMYRAVLSFNLLLIIPGILLIAINAITWGTLVAIINTRFRDFAQIITSVIQVIFFATPIMWTPDMLPAQLRWIVHYNPFNQFLGLLREPLLGQTFNVHGLTIVFVVTLIGLIASNFALKVNKHRIVFWL